MGTSRYVPNSLGHFPLATDAPSTFIAGVVLLDGLLLQLAATVVGIIQMIQTYLVVSDMFRCFSMFNSCLSEDPPRLILGLKPAMTAVYEMVM
jgi:hypothetical protein